MKKALLSIFILLGLLSCEKENTLDDVILNNPNDVETVNYLEVVNLRQLSCSVIKFDLQVNTSNIPNGLYYTHYLIKDKYNRPRKTTETKDIVMSLPCNIESRYELTLFNDTTNKESLPSIYTYKP